MIGGVNNNMVTVKDIPAGDFIKEYATFLKQNNKLDIPKWTDYVKTSCLKEMPPQNQDWVYIRVAALARKVFLRGHIGVSTLQHIFGGSQRRGTKKPTHRAASGKIIRFSLQTLEKLNVVRKDTKSQLKQNSRIITSKGQTDLNRIANQIAQRKQQQ